MKLLLLGVGGAVLGLIILALAIMILARWAQRKQLEEMMRAEGLLREARRVPAAICHLTAEQGRWINADIFLSRKRICAFQSIWQPPFIHAPFQEAAFEMVLSAGEDQQQRPYLGLGTPSQQGEVRFFIANAREWLCDIERLNNHCSPETCADFDPAVCGGCPGESKPVVGADQPDSFFV